jgi:hypothetical protein
MNELKGSAFDDYTKVVKIIDSIDSIMHIQQVHGIVKRFYNKWNDEARGLPSLSLKLSEKKHQLGKAK